MSTVIQRRPLDDNDPNGLRESDRDFVLNNLDEAVRRLEQGTGLDPEFGFMLEGANAGELAAYDYAVQSHCVATLAILDGKDTGEGSNNEPWATVRKRLVELVKKTQSN